MQVVDCQRLRKGRLAVGWKFPGLGHGDRDRARATETKGRETVSRRNGRQRGREAERQRDEEVEATERDASSNRNVKGGEEVRLGTRSVKPGYEIRNVGNVKNYQCEELAIWKVRTAGL